MNEGDFGVVRQEVRQLVLQLRRIEPVRVDRRDCGSCPDRRECVLGSSPTPPDVVMIHSAAEHQVAIRIESPAQFVRMVVEVALDGIPATAKGIFPALGIAPETISRVRALIDR